MPYYPEREHERNEEKRAPGRKKGLRPALVLAMAFSVILIICGGVQLISYIAELAASREISSELKQIHDKGEEDKGTEPPVNGEAADAQVIPGGGEGAETEKTATREAEKADSPETVTVEQSSTAEATEGKTASAASDKLPAVPYPDNPGLRVSDRFIALGKKSGYIIGWLSMDGVDEAVVLKDNTFFLNHDAMGRRNSNGAIFIDQGTNLLTRPYTVILYGHNMKSGNMFGKLKKYRDNDYLYDNLIIRFDSLYEEGKYAVFAALEFSTYPGDYAWFDLWPLASDKRSEREAAIQALKNRAAQGSVLDVGADDQLLLLITCLDGENKRLMVAARRLREGETETSLTFRK